METNDKTKEPGNGNLKSDEQLLKKFAKSESSAEIKNISNEITESDPDINKEKQDEGAAKFHKEKKEDAQKEAKNDADFQQPKSNDADA